MPEDTITQPTPIRSIKVLGKEHMKAGRILEAIKVFSEGLSSAPDDPELYMTLGELYHLTGDDKLALLMFNQAKQRAPEMPGIDERLTSLNLPTHLSPANARTPVPDEMEDVSELLQYMTRRDAPISDEEIQQAADLLKMILTSQQPAQTVAENLDEIDNLLPALIELNIRQANVDGQTELAEGLGELLLNIQLQVEKRDRTEQRPRDHMRLSGSVSGGRPRTRPHVLLMSPESPESNHRLLQAAEALSNLGCQIRHADLGPVDLSDKPDVVIVNNPHITPQLMQKLAIYAAADVPIIQDLDQDFEEMPSNHPDYARMGLGNLNTARGYMAGLILARRVTVPSATLAEALSMARCPVRVVPDGWSNKNPLWEKLPPRRSTFNLGWAGKAGQSDDMALIQRLVIRIMRSFLQTQLVIAGDANVFRLFDTLPETRKLFLPATSPEENPYTYSQFDLLMAPMRNIPFNRAQSDRSLVEAGVRKIPWVASPMPAFNEWANGGLLADTSDSWYDGLQRLVSSEELRQELAEKGYQKAQQREVKQIGQAWLTVVQECLGSLSPVPINSYQEAKL